MLSVRQYLNVCQHLVFHGYGLMFSRIGDYHLFCHGCGPMFQLVTAQSHWWSISVCWLILILLWFCPNIFACDSLVPLTFQFRCACFWTSVSTCVAIGIYTLQQPPKQGHPRMHQINLRNLNLKCKCIYLQMMLQSILDCCASDSDLCYSEEVAICSADLEG